MKNVTIYTSSSCSYCHAAKDYFNENNIPYTEKNVSEDPEARKTLIQQKIMGVPAIFIEDEVVVGFDKERINELLEI